MFSRVCVAAVSCAMAAGCVTIQTQPTDGISINKVVERVKCELGQAVSANKDLLSWAGVITLTLEVDQTGSVAPSATLVGPVGAGLYGVDFGGGVSGKSIQTSLVNVYFPVYELAELAGRCPLDPQHPLEDRLGLREWVDRALELKSSGGLFKDKDKAIGYTVEFDLEISAGVTPSFTFARISERTGVSASRKHVNTLEVALADANLKPPHVTIIRQKVATPPEKKGSSPMFDGQAPVAGESRQDTVERRVSRGGTPLSARDKDRLDTIIRQLQLKNLRLRL